jgi:hypothetical protein
MPSQRFILLIDTQAWRLARFKGKQFCELRKFGIDEAGQAALSEWMNAYSGARLAVLTNLPDEHYQVDVMPMARGAAGRLLLKRKLAAWPYAQGFYTAFHLDTLQTSRLENRFLFAGLFFPPLTDWLTKLEAAALRLQGVYTQAVLMPYCLPASAQRLSDCICVHFEHTAVCLSYFKHQRLCFRRRLSIPTQEVHDVQAVIPALIQLRQALVSQFGLSESASLPVFCITPEKHIPEVPVLPVPFQWQSITEDALIQAIGQGPLPTDISAVEWVALHAILADQPLPNLATEASLLPDKLKQLQRTIHWAGMGLALLLVLLSVIHMLATQQLHAQAQAVQAKLKNTSSTPLVAGLRPEQLPAIRALTSAVQAISAATRLPDQALHDLQPILSELHAWQLIRLEWQAELPAATSTETHAYQALHMTFQRKETGRDAVALREWQALIQHLTQLPSVKQLQIAAPSPQHEANRRQGSTDPLAMLALQPVLSLTWADSKQEPL